MSDSMTGVIHTSSEGGISASHAELRVLPVFAGPSTAAEKNSASAGLIPVACWRVHDVRFAFDSSFLKPEVAAEINLLAALRQKHALKASGGAGLIVYPPVSIFGHADPVNTDAYNKILSGRRATAVYALLTRDTGLWESLYAKREGGDDWGTPSIIVMLRTLGFAAGPGPGEDPETKRAIREFQVARGLAVDGVAGPKTRALLFREYMDALCGSDFQLDKQDDFLAGTDFGGKGDYQGCSEFNPVLLFSKEEEAEFSKAANREQRNAENAPNRRVIILLFRPGSRVAAAKWPCPRATEGIERCKNRFWSDAQVRRTPGEKRRMYESSGDTFACRFYDRLVKKSPCEQGRVGPGDLGVHVYDPDTGEALDGAQVWLESGDVEVANTVTNDDGIAIFPGLSAGSYRITSAKQRCAVVVTSAVVSPGVTVEPTAFKNGIAEEAAADSKKPSPGPLPSTVSMPSPVLRGIYFENESDGKKLFELIKKLTRDTLELRPDSFVPPGSSAKPPVTKMFWVVRITGRDNASKSKDTGTRLIRDLTEKNPDCKVTLPTPKEIPLVLVKIDGGVIGKDSKFDLGHTDSAEDDSVEVKLRSADLEAERKAKNSRIEVGRAFWVTNTPPRLANGQSTPTLVDDKNPALSLADNAFPEPVTTLIVLAHELVHAWRHYYAPASSGAAGSVVYDGKHKKRFECPAGVEELKTVGLCDPSPSHLSGGVKDDPRIPTENRIRAEQDLALRAAYPPIEECPYRRAARVVLKVTDVKVKDIGEPWSIQKPKWHVSVSVEVTPLNPVGTYQNGADVKNFLEGDDVKEGTVLNPKSNQYFECDLVIGGQSVMITSYGSYSFGVFSDQSRPLSRATDTACRLPKPLTGEIPTGVPASGAKTAVSSDVEPENGTYELHYQSNTMGFWDPWDNLWDKP